MPSDNLLAFTNDNGRITFTGLNAVIPANVVQRWIVACSLAGGAPTGNSFQLILTNATVVDAEYINPFTLDATPAGNFAIEGAVFTIGSGGNPGDSDHDGLPDWWELFYFGDLSHDGTGDSDGDGLTDYEEFLLGTNPVDAASALRIIPPLLFNGTDVTVTWSAAPERTYRLQQRNVIGSGVWMDVAGDVTATNVTAQKMDAGAANQSARFYRVAPISSGDSDADGLSDGWEQLHFGDLSRDGTGDFDHDGASDAFELLAGTNPDNLNSHLKIKPNPVIAGNAVTVEWEANAGRSYRLQFKNSLSDPTWQTLPGKVTATGTTASQTDSTISGQNQRYYRVLLEP